MSRASEWVARFAEVKGEWPAAYVAPASDNESRQVYARVTEGGKCGIQLSTYQHLDPDIAVALARWILDTFGEPS